MLKTDHSLQFLDVIFNMLINIKLQTICWNFTIYEQDKFHAGFSWAWNSLITLASDLNRFPSFTHLKQQNPRLKTMLAVGGWTMGSKPFMETVASADNMHKFAEKTIHFLRQHNFDGLDIDWEYSPRQGGALQKTKTRFTQLLQVKQILCALMIKQIWWCF